jgi:hypothetical protein
LSTGKATQVASTRTRHAPRTVTAKHDASSEIGDVVVAGDVVVPGVVVVPGSVVVEGVVVAPPT